MTGVVLITLGISFLRGVGGAMGSFGVLTSSGVLGGIFFFFFCFPATSSSPPDPHCRLLPTHLTAAAVFRRGAASATPEVAASTAEAAATAAVAAAATAATPVLMEHQEVDWPAAAICRHR